LTPSLDALDVDGYVVLRGVIDTDVLDAMQAKLDDDIAEIQRRAGSDGLEHFGGHVSHAMPPFNEHIHSGIVTNPLVIQLTCRILGAGLHLHFYNCNTVMPGSEEQYLHRDAPHLGPDPIHPIISVIVNVPTADVDESNGAIEVWPGTHRFPGSTRVGAQAEARQRAVVPPVRVPTRKGDVLLRDPRLWHRGMPNPSAEPRHMIAMVHSKWFYQRDVTIPVTHDALHAFDDEVLTTRVHLVPDDYDYLSEAARDPGHMTRSR
jgi:ectoine hydroxylase-related dioxygenase (phytanoyl-CoA dioxygenase family)